MSNRMQVTYSDLMKVATDSGCVAWVHADVVYSKDEFSVSIGDKPVHRYNAFTDRGNVVGAYCSAKLTNGDYLTEVMSLEDLQKAEACSKNRNTWSTWRTEMQKKAVMKRAFKRLPLSGSAGVSIQEMINKDNEDVGGYTLPQEETKKTKLDYDRFNNACKAVTEGRFDKAKLLSEYDLTEDQRAEAMGL